MSKKGEDTAIKLGKTEEAPKTEAQMQREANIQRKRAADELASYKKRIRESNELKRLQVEELQLNIAYHDNKKAWMDLAPSMLELEKREQEIQAEQQEARRKEFEESQAALAEIGDDKPEESKIVIPKVGKPRSETEKK
jgi:hypothetical protein